MHVSMSTRATLHVGQFSSIVFCTFSRHDYLILSHSVLFEHKQKDLSAFELQIFYNNKIEEKIMKIEMRMDHAAYR